MGEAKKTGKLWLRWFLVVDFIVLVLAGATFYWIFLKPNHATPMTTEPTELKIKSGTDFPKIVTALFQKNIIENKRSFVWAARLSGTMNQIKAGKYRISPGLSNQQLIKLLTEGKTQIDKITIPEGKNFDYYASILQQKIEIDSVRFATLVHDSSFTRSLGIDAPNLNGYLFPDTYFFSWGMTEEQCLKVLVRQFQKMFPDSIRDRDPELNLSRHQMVILASLVEGEAQLEGEFEIVSAVYRNRLKIGMLLQSCPTIQHIIPDGPRRLLYQDLEIESPYNTYIHPGLPPGPINNPGRRALLAAAYPEDVPFLYMVARGDGGHTFSRSLSGHLNAKKIFDIYRQQVNREQRNHRKK